MAGSEGSGQTQLLSGWLACVVHRPSEDPEPSELPSTVDMAAFSTGLNGVEAANATENNDNSDSDSDSDGDSSNSGSDASPSCSQSEESSESDSSSSSQESSSRSPSPEFSVTSSQTNGLRLTIATVRKSCSSPPVEKQPKTSVANDKQLSTSKSSSSDSHCSKSDSDSNSDTEGPSNKSDVKKSVKKCGVKAKSKLPEKKPEKKAVRKEPVTPTKSGAKVKIKPKKTQKMASLPLSRGSTCSSSDSEESDADSAMLASCSLQEIRQEDLAAILPDQQECDAFGGFECRADKNSTQTGDASGSDIELPQQAVNALIQRTTESSSESESHPPPNPNTLYANSLLQQFVVQTQSLNTPSANSLQAGDSVGIAAISDVSQNALKTGVCKDGVKRKRGRPRKSKGHKISVDNKNSSNGDFCGNPNVSPDSGIQNSPDHVSSPEPSPKPAKLKKEGEVKKANCDVKTTDNKNSASSNNGVNKPKVPVTSNRFDRLLYANTDRVLYPPRRKGRPQISKKGPGRPPKHKISPENADKSSKTVEKNDRRENKTKKSHKNTRENDIQQITSNTGSLSLGKCELKINGVSKDTAPRKSKSKLLFEICERVSKRLELNNKYTQEGPKADSNKPPKLKIHKNRAVLAAKNKNDQSRLKYTTLKNAKLMHSKHKHKKHKKCKFKILKPVTAATVDPKINTEIEKLIADFVKLCSISVTKPSKENVPEIIKAIKKASKKRKTSEYNERKKKKQSVSNVQTKETNSNEQRLPLKKRHYHLSTNDTKPENAEVEPVNNKVPPVNGVPVIKSSSPKITALNNNDYDVCEVKPEVAGSHIDEAIEACITPPESHIDEAIEACITRYTSPIPEAQKSPVKTRDSSPKTDKTSCSITATTPKKRHRLEIMKSTEVLTIKTEDLPIDSAATKQHDSPKIKTKTTLESVVSELKMKKNLSQKADKKVESVAQIITRKKNRLEDLTLSLVSKISSSPVEPDPNSQKRKKTEEADRDSVIKYPACKKAKPVELEKLDFINAKPTGIFMPTIDIELQIPSSTVIVSKEVVEDMKFKESRALLNKPEVKVEVPEVVVKETKLLTNAEVVSKKKIRKRRAINRTGFPTVKKKKKKLQSSESSVVDQNQMPQTECDRVPKSGEEYLKFLQRTERTLPVPEKIQKAPSDSNISASCDTESISKWEALSECDSLPQEERTEIEQDDLKPDLKLRSRDLSPSTSSEKSRFSRRETSEDLDDLTLEARIKRIKTRTSRRAMLLRKRTSKTSGDDSSTHSMQKRKLRDLSPASSIEPFLEKKFREERASASSDEAKRTRKVPRWRKRYLVAGLFSDYYKEDDEAAKQRRSEMISNKTRLTYNKNEHPYGLLPPPYHCGKYLRNRKLPFQLPFDLWWQHTHSQLPGRDSVPSWNYRKIRTNVYNVKNSTGACEPQACNCSPTSHCGDDCINRLVLAECPASHKCKNQKIQKHDWAPGLEKFMTESKGWGVRTKEPIKSGDFILEYVGEVVSDQEFKERMATRYVHDTHHYCLHLDGGLVIDGHRMGGDGRFVNHSCHPNCEMQKWSVNGQFRMALFALRDISAGEELTYDYNFSLFNPAEGQECKCGSANCRGVIGGKSQRVRQSTVPVNNSEKQGSGRVGRPRKNPSKRATSKPKEQQPMPTLPPILQNPVVKPMSHQQKCYVLEHHCFLLRNLSKVKVKQMRERSICSVTIARNEAATPTEHNATDFLNHLNALQKPRNMRTRRLAQAEDDPQLNKTAKLATILRELYEVVVQAKDKDGELLSVPFVALPSKRKVPELYQRITDPIDLTTIEQNITTGVYRTADLFDLDMNRLFGNFVRFYGRTSEVGIAATRLKKIYSESKKERLQKFEEIVGEKPPPSFVPRKNQGEEEDVIRCICGMFRDEGLMIQCERCLVWQHCECVKADEAAPSYHCEKCVPRKVDYEIALDEFTEHGHRYYMTLMRGDLQLRQSDTVYVLRDIPIPGTDKKHTYDTIGEIKYTDLDIFRVERLWKDSKTGQRMAYGHHYLRPHETYHEPTRKFFPNEVMRVPLYEAVPVELVISHCWVMDINTYCKGRPIGAPEEHIYICEYRVDKTARLFSKISKSKFPICTKSYAFERFDARLKICRTYTPHDLDPAVVKPRGRKPQENDEVRVLPQIAVHVPVVRTPAEKKTRLNKILLNLLSKLPTKQVLDVSYLLEGGRRRKKQN